MPDVEIKSKAVTRWYVFGKSFPSRRAACKAIARKEIVIYAAEYVKPKEEGLKNEPLGSALAFLFDDFCRGPEEDGYYLGEGSRYRAWVKAREQALMNGAEPVLVRDPVDDREGNEIGWQWSICVQKGKGLFPHASYYAPWLWSGLPEPEYVKPDPPKRLAKADEYDPFSEE
jgi:hypothetical protein